MAKPERAERGRDSVVGEGTRVRGRVHGEGDLVVSGTVEGDVTLRGHLHVDKGGAVMSNVDATSVTVSGRLEGNVTAKGAVVLGSGADVKGDVHGASVTLEDGARFSGRLDCEFELPTELSGTVSRRR